MGEAHGAVHDRHRDKMSLDEMERVALNAAKLLTVRIVSFDGRPFAYAQDYAVHVWPQPHFARLPPGSRAIDSFIGEPHMIGGATAPLT